MRKTALILSAAITAGILAGCAGGRQTANTGGEKLSIWMQLMKMDIIHLLQDVML